MSYSSDGSVARSHSDLGSLLQCLIVVVIIHVWHGSSCKVTRTRQLGYYGTAGPNVTCAALGPVVQGALDD
jgi:hypothetical protein